MFTVKTTSIIPAVPSVRFGPEKYPTVAVGEAKVEKLQTGVPLISTLPVTTVALQLPVPLFGHAEILGEKSAVNFCDCGFPVVQSPEVNDSGLMSK
jgi:hypothetical protein